MRHFLVIVLIGLASSAFGATLVSVDTSAAERMPGVVVVHDGNFLGVAAPSATIAANAINAIKAEWKAHPERIRQVLGDGAQTARVLAHDTMEKVRQALGLYA